MMEKTDCVLLKDDVSRRSFLQRSLGAAAFAGAGAFSAQQISAAADGGLVALVHTQAAGDNGPIDSMIASLKKLSGEKKFQIRTIYAQDAATYGTIFKSLADAGAAVIAATFNEVAEPIKALAPQYPKTKWIQIFGDPINPTTIISAAISPACSPRNCQRPARSVISAASACRRSTPT
jgi:basic membrane protein A